MKYSLRNFLAVFLVSIVIFAVAAVFLVQYISSTILSSAISDETTEPETTTQATENKPLENTTTLSYLILGLGDSGEADHILLVHINKSAETFLVSSIPSNLKISVDGGHQTLGMLAATRGIDFVRAKVYALTAVKPDYLISLDADGFENIIDILGGVEFYVPQAMQQSIPEEGVSIDLAEGKQTLTGAQAASMLRFTAYSGENASVEQANTCRALVIALCRTVLTTDNLMRASELLKDVYDNVTTDMTYTTASVNLEVLFNFPNYELRELVYPGHTDGEYYVGGAGDGLTAYADYR